MAKQSELYDEKARECEQHAEPLHDPNMKLLWIALAKQWRDLAEKIRAYEI